MAVPPITHLLQELTISNNTTDLMKQLSINNISQEQPTNIRIHAIEINKVHTELVIGNFANRYLIIATQYGKIGNLLKATVDEISNRAGLTERVSHIAFLFGAEDIEQQAAVRHIVEHLELDKTLLIFLCLKEYSKETVKTLREALVQVFSEDGSN